MTVKQYLGLFVIVDKRFLNRTILQYHTGLNSVLFAISIDNPELNAIRPARGLEDIMSSASEAFSSTPPPTGYVPGMEEPRPVMGGNDVIIGKYKRYL